jgi:hypothetical protein
MVKTLVMAFGFVLASLAGRAHAGQTLEQKCQNALYDAARIYAACQMRVQARIYGGTIEKFWNPASRCRDTYRDTWSELQASFPGTSCSGDRFVDNGNGTVTDRLTRLTWEQKTDDSTVHDKDNHYTWSSYDDLEWSDADGTVYTDFLTSLNDGACFAGQCDWRLPTREELQTIVSEPYPCNSSPCIDAIFGPTESSVYLSQTTDAANPWSVWGVYFADGGTSTNAKTASLVARAVRGGL